MSPLPPFHLAPPGWEPSHPNPFRADGTYGPGWGHFALMEWDNETLITGRGATGLFSAAAGRHVADLAARLCDFLRYETAHGRQVILRWHEDADGEALIRSAWESTADPRAVRPSDPPVVVHSTSCEAWPAIRQQGLLTSYVRLRAEGALAEPPLAEDSELARYYAGEPPEYGDYVMFGLLGHPMTECLQASKQQGEFRLDPDVPYRPGARLYFDLHRIIRDGLAVRDGLHLAKVRGQLPVSPYLLGTVNVQDIGADRDDWTPRRFTEEADRAFEHQRA